MTEFVSALTPQLHGGAWVGRNLVPRKFLFYRKSGGDSCASIPAQVVLCALVALCAGCAEQAEESKVTIWRELPSAPGSLFTQPGSSELVDRELKQRSMTPTNKRCAEDSSMRNGQLVLFADGIPPHYVLFDIPESQLQTVLAIQPGLYLLATPEAYGFFQMPLYKCEDRGY